MSDQGWYYLEEGQQKGPMRRDQLLGEVGRRLPPSTPVWRDGMSGWLPADQVSELAAELRPVAPPLPTAPVAAPPRVAAPSAPGHSGWEAPVAAPTGGLATTRDDEPRSLNPISILRRSFRWSGRFSRMEFFLGGIVVGVVGGLMMAPSIVLDAILGAEATAAVLIGGLVALAAIVFVIGGYGGLTVRRLHDLGQSGWLALLMLVPCVGNIMWFWLVLAPGRASSSAAPLAAGAPAGRMSPAVLALIIIVGGFALVAGLGIVAAIAIPSLLRARVSANESATIGDLRTLAAAGSAQKLDRGLLVQKNGYVRTLHTGASSDSYAVVAHPVNVGQTGVRLFCADAGRRLCAMSAGSPEALIEKSEDGAQVRCSAQCSDLP